MSSNSTAAGGVRNLRAMFENKASDSLSTSPPSRGRSPADSDASAHSRPVSKVRASFVAVERPGEAGQGQQWGLRKASDVSSMADIKADSAAPWQPVKESHDTTPAHTSNVSLDGGLGSILKGSAFEPSTPEKSTKKSELKVNGTGRHDKKDDISEMSPVTVPPSAAAMVDKMNAAKDSGKPQHPPTTKLVTTKTAQPIKPPPTRQVQPKPSVKSPVQPKTPKTPTTPASNATPKPKQSVVATTPVTRLSKAPETKVSQPAKTFAEKDTKVNGVQGTATASPKLTTKPQSPPRTTQRVEPVTKAKADHQENGTKSKSPVEARPSMGNRPPRTTGLPTSSSLHKKASRSSLPVRSSVHDRPKSRVSTTTKPADESFLARMMRPTASTAQKAHEKVQVGSPPRGNKSSQVPKTRKSLGNLKLENKENEDGVSPVEKKAEAVLPAEAEVLI